MAFICQLCSYRCLTWRCWVRHVFEAHSNEPHFSFTCGIEGCSTTFKTYSALSSHLNRKHTNATIVSQQENPSVCCNTSLEHSNESDSSLMTTGEDVSSQNVALNGGSQRMAALFLLSLKEKYHLTQSSVNFAVGQVTGMMEFIAADIRVAVEEKLRTALNDTGVNLPCLDDCFNNINPFDGIMSEHMQTKFYKENFYLVVSPLHTV